MTTKGLIRKYNSIQKRLEKLGNEMKELQVQAQGICDHSIYHDWIQTRGDGYGSTYSNPHRSCLICGQKFMRYGNSPWRPYKESDVCDPWPD